MSKDSYNENLCSHNNNGGQEIQEIRG